MSTVIWDADPDVHVAVSDIRPCYDYKPRYKTTINARRFARIDALLYTSVQPVLRSNGIYHNTHILWDRTPVLIDIIHPRQQCRARSLFHSDV